MNTLFRLLFLEQGNKNADEILITENYRKQRVRTSCSGPFYLNKQIQIHLHFRVCDHIVVVPDIQTCLWTGGETLCREADPHCLVFQWFPYFANIYCTIYKPANSCIDQSDQIIYHNMAQLSTENSTSLGFYISWWLNLSNVNLVCGS